MEKTHASFNYQKEKLALCNLKIRSILKELPAVCNDYFMSISQTTSPLTRLAYAYDLRLFFQYLCTEELSFANSNPTSITLNQLDSISTKEITRFQNYLLQYVRNTPTPSLIQNNSLGIMRKLCSLRSFFEYLFKSEMIHSNVTTLVPLPKKKDRPIIYFTDEESQDLITVVLNGEGLTEKQKRYLNITRKRDLAIIMLFLGTGIRVSELVGLDVNDFNFDDNAFLVTRKGGNQTILYFPDPVKEILLSYFEERKNIVTDSKNEAAFFLSLQKKRITTRAVENLIKKYAVIAAPLKKKVSPHKLRSTFGTNLYQKTGDIYLVADALGHADVNTTRKHYAAMSDQRKREAAKKVVLPDISQTDDIT